MWHMKLCLLVNNLHMMTLWVDTSYAVHWDSRIHTGMVMSMVLGAAMSVSWRQELNTGSSTEAEIVGIDDALKYIIWGLYFIKEQGYEVNKKILMQDKNRPYCWPRMAGFLDPKGPSKSRTYTL